MKNIAIKTSALTALSSIGLLCSLSGQAAPSATASGVYVHLFEWLWKDIAVECETFLGPKGYKAVQVSPPNEHAVLPEDPWYERYQPVSYQLTSRSGSRSEFIDMVRRCKKAGVDIYVDAVINHMSWVNRSGALMFGIAGTPYGEYHYGSVYEASDFHRCGRNGDDSIMNYQDRWEVQNCNLATCSDLRTESEKVRQNVANYLNDLLDIGVAGFRIDAAKHMASGDIYAIFSRLKKPFYAFQEVIDFGSEPIRSEEYYGTGDVTDFRYPRQLARAFNVGLLSWLEHFGEAWGFVPGNKTVVFTDNHDIQRGHGGGGEVLTHRDGQKYVLANIFMLAWPYGYPQIMSSYRFSNSEQGPPTSGAGTSQTGRPTLAVHSRAGVNCGGEAWICEHRIPEIAAMVGFRKHVDTAYVTKWWSNGYNFISFARGNRGYVAINKEFHRITRWFDTGLPAGTYCDVLSGGLAEDGLSCAGTAIVVNKDGWAPMDVGPNTAMAIHGGARLPQ